MRCIPGLAIAVVAGMALQLQPASASNYEVDYFGTNLFLGLAYHRWGCAIDGPYSNSHVTSNNTYQGFTQKQNCYAGWTWQDEASYASTTYGWSSGGNVGDDWLGYYFCQANYVYGEAMAYGDPGDWHNYCHSWQGAMYSNNSTWDRTDRDPSNAINSCSYNILTNCNSDCWIQDFSSRQGTYTVPIASPCW